MKRLTPSQKSILKRMLYENIVILHADRDGFPFFSKRDQRKLKDLNIGKIHKRTFNSLKEYFYSKPVQIEWVNFCLFELNCSGVYTASNTRLIEMAKKAVQKKSKKFTPKNNPHRLIFVDTDGDYLEEVNLGSKDNVICEACAEEKETVVKYIKMWKAGEIVCEEDGAVSIEVDELGDIDTEDFVICQECWELIGLNYYHFSNDELNHWLKDRGVGDYSEGECWELMQILESHLERPELTPRIEELARRVVEEK